MYNDKFRVRVLPFNDGRYYSIEYKYKGWFKDWIKLIDPFMLSDTERQENWFHPMLISNFDFAVKEAECLTPESIQSYLNDCKIKWDRKYNQIKTEQAIRMNKHWEKAV